MNTTNPVQLGETDPEFPFRVIIDKCNVALGSHWHKEIEFIYLQQFGLNAEINGHKYSLNEGDIIFVAPGDVHGASHSANYIRIVVQFDDDLLRDNYISEQDIGLVLEHLSKIPRTSRRWPEGTAKEIKRIIINLADEYISDKNNTFKRLSIKSLVYELIMLCLKEIPTDENRESSLNPSKNKEILNNLKDILKYVNNNYNRKITINDAAEILNFSPNYFVRFFKKYMGITFHDYLNRYRINMAIMMLRNSSMPINLISAETGFSNVKTFNRIFKMTTGLCPGKYKKVNF